MLKITESTKRNQAFLISFSLIFVLLILTSCGSEEKPYTEQDIRALNRWIDANPEGPSQLLRNEIETARSVIFLQDNLLRSDSITMLKGILPSLYGSGIRNLGIFYLARTSQAEVDAYVSGSSEISEYDLLRSSDIRLGYEEYADFLRYVRDCNYNLPDEESITVTALGVMDELSVEMLSGILTAEAGPVFIWLDADDSEKLPAINAEDTSPPPLIVAHFGPVDGEKVFGGFIESVTSGRDMRDRSFSFRPAETPFSDWDSLTVPDEAEIVIVTPFAYSPVTPIPDFVRVDDLQRAREFFPELGNNNMPESQARKINRAISRRIKRND